MANKEITMNTILRSQSRAWRLMSQKRTCPPLSVLQVGSEHALAHLCGCSLCRDRLESAPLLDKLGTLLDSIPLTVENTDVHPGDVRRVRPWGNSSDWFGIGGRYHNPPLVLVLNEPDETGFVTVAQVFDEEDLCDTGDVTIGDGLFAEAWNVYGLPSPVLSRHAYCRVGGDAVRKVLAASEKNFPEIGEDSPLYWFRQCELETGSYFSLRLNAEALVRQEEKEEQEQRSAPRNLLEEAKRLIKRLLPRLDSEIPLPMAASSVTFGPDDDGAEKYRVCVLYVVLSDGTGDSEQGSLEAEVHVFPPSRRTCTAYFRLPVGLSLVDNGVIAEYDSAATTLHHAKCRSDGIWETGIKFSSVLPEKLDEKKLRIGLVLYHEADA